MDNYYVYEITNCINNKRYIGKRHCKCKIEDDSYMGSGVLIKRAIEKYGIKNFSKKILKVCNSEKEAYDAEKEFIKNANAVLSNQYYNLAGGGEGGWEGASYNVKEPIIFCHDEYVDNLKNKKIHKSDCHSPFYIRYYIEHLILNGYNEQSIIQEIKYLAKDYFSKWNDDFVNKEILSVYNDVINECCGCQELLYEKHTDIPITIYCGELKRINTLQNKWYIRYLFAALVLYKFSRSLNKVTNNVPFYEQYIIKIAGTRTKAQRIEIWEYLEKENLICFHSDGTYDVLIAEDTSLSKSNVFVDIKNYKNIMLCLRYYQHDSKIDMCQKCGCFIEQNKNHTKKYCEICSRYKRVYILNHICVDCGKEFVTSSMGHSIRCSDCQTDRNRLLASERMRRYRKK